MAVSFHAYQSRAEDIRMRVEHRFTRNGEQRLGCSDHALRFPSAKPEPAALVENANVTHAVIEAAAGNLDLRQGRGFGTIEICRRDPGAPYRDLADLSLRQNEVIA